MARRSHVPFVVGPSSQRPELRPSGRLPVAPPRLSRALERVREGMIRPPLLPKLPTDEAEPSEDRTSTGQD